MTHILLIGNSHAGCLKRAWGRVSGEYQSIEIEFAAGAGDYMKNTEVEDGFLVFPPRTFSSKKRLRCELGKLDCIWLYGLGLPGYTGQGIFFTEETRKTATEEYLRGSIPYSILMKLRRQSEIPIFISHEPIIAAKPGEKLGPEVTLYSDWINDVSVFQLNKKKVEFLAQAQSTIVGECRTDPEFSRDGVGFGTSGLDDRRHMNIAFGQISLEHSIPIILDKTAQ